MAEEITREFIHRHGGCPDTGGSAGCPNGDCDCEFKPMRYVAATDDLLDAYRYLAAAPTVDYLYGRPVKGVEYSAHQRAWIVRLGALPGEPRDATTLLTEEMVEGNRDLGRMISKYDHSGWTAKVRHGHAYVRPEAGFQVVTNTEPSAVAKELTGETGGQPPSFLAMAAIMGTFVTGVGAASGVFAVMLAGTFFLAVTCVVFVWKFREDLFGGSMPSFTALIEGAPEAGKVEKPHARTYVVLHYGFTPGKGTRLRSRPPRPLDRAPTA